MVLLVLLLLASKGKLNTFNASWAVLMLLIACAESRSVLLCTIAAAFISWRPSRASSSLSRLCSVRGRDCFVGSYSETQLSRD